MKELSDFPEWNRLVAASQRIEEVGGKVPDFPTKFAQMMHASVNQDEEWLTSFLDALDGQGIPLRDLLMEADEAQGAAFANPELVSVFVEAVSRNKANKYYRMFQQLIPQLAEAYPDDERFRQLVRVGLMVDVQGA